MCKCLECVRDKDSKIFSFRKWQKKEKRKKRVKEKAALDVYRNGGTKKNQKKLTQSVQ